MLLLRQQGFGFLYREGPAIAYRWRILKPQSSGLPCLEEAEFFLQALDGLLLTGPHLLGARTSHAAMRCQPPCNDLSFEGM